MPPTKGANPYLPCPCSSHLILANCCNTYIEGRKNAPTAEILMRSRYTAHVLLAVDYLWKTSGPKQRANSTTTEILAWASSCEWLGLQIHSTTLGTEDDHEGSVVFTARYRQAGTLQHHHEISLFEKMEDAWLYIGHHH